MKKDIIILGGGLVGLTMGLALARHDFTVAIIDRMDYGSPSPDGRASAIAKASGQLFQVIDFWDKIKDKVQPIHHIRVCDGRPRPRLRFDSPDPQNQEEAMGYMIENHILLDRLIKAAQAHPQLELLGLQAVADVDRGAAGVTVTLKPRKEDSATQEVKAQLLISCEGRNSTMRHQAGILSTSWRYDHKALVTILEHEADHHATAWEDFQGESLMALLPLQGRRTALVWANPERISAGLDKLSQEALTKAIEAKVADRLGTITLAAPVLFYPLSFQHAQSYIDHRLALVGDSAHAIHPVAGQGYNIGVRDIAALVEVLHDSRLLGLDLGSREVLQQYQIWRRPDVLSSCIAMDGLVRLFAIDRGPIRPLRRLGMGIMDRLPAVKNLFRQEAMGLAGDVPKLLTGKFLT